MTPAPKPEPIPDDTHEIRLRRVQTLAGVWRSFVKYGWFDPERVRLSDPLVNEVVEQYLADRKALKARYHIEGRIQLYKIAGLMGASIMRFRPAVHLASEMKLDQEMYANELLAIYHGLAICAEHSENRYEMGFLDEPWFGPWRDEMLFFLHFRNYTPESLCMIFFTLMQAKFPDNLQVSHD